MSEVQSVQAQETIKDESPQESNSENTQVQQASLPTTPVSTGWPLPVKMVQDTQSSLEENSDPPEPPIFRSTFFWQVDQKMVNKLRKVSFERQNAIMEEDHPRSLKQGRPFSENSQRVPSDDEKTEDMQECQDHESKLEVLQRLSEVKETSGHQVSTSKSRGELNLGENKENEHCEEVSSPPSSPLKRQNAVVVEDADVLCATPSGAETTSEASAASASPQVQDILSDVPEEFCALVGSTAQVTAAHVRGVHLESRSWRGVMRDLGLEEQDVDAIYDDWRPNLHEAVYRMLELWIQKRGTSSTLDVLAKILLKAKQHDALRSLAQAFEMAPTPTPPHASTQQSGGKGSKNAQASKIKTKR